VSDEALTEILTTARELGFLGPGPVEAHLRHGHALARLLGDFSGSFVDLGSGGGVPGLVLLGAWPRSQAVLVDVSQRRCRFLRRAVAELGLSGRAQVWCGRAEELAREPSLREAHPLLVARGFGAPPVVAECGVGFVSPGGALAISEPPPSAVHADARVSLAARRRWPEPGLGRLGLALEAELRAPDAGVVLLRKREPSDDRWPRRTGVPGKRPLW
jgi:16S rRNA (guanine527-N7)-methyltransferase